MVFGFRIYCTESTVCDIYATIYEMPYIRLKQIRNQRCVVCIIVCFITSLGMFLTTTFNMFGKTTYSIKRDNG